MKPYQVVLSMLAMIIVAGLLILAPGGRWHWSAGWLCWGMLVSSWLAMGAVLLLANPALLMRRTRPGEGTPSWDLALLCGLHVGMVTQLVIGSLEGRTPPAGLWWAGCALFLGGQVGLLASMLTNPFFEATVRHQSDQGQRVIDTGPYAWVRHPGYAAGLAYLLAPSLFLGSLWSGLGFLMVLVSLYARVCLEEEFLREHLEGYVDYCRRVRYRFLPYVI